MSLYRPIPHPRLRRSASRRLLGPTVHRRVREKLFRLLVEELLRIKVPREVIASALGVHNSRVHAIFAGHIALFNSETLIEMLYRLGVETDVIITERFRVPYFGPEAPKGWVSGPR
jgi:predicted XRE-type DNA-binding protein